MQIDNFEFSEYAGQPREWSLERTQFGQITLIVGRNASGKSRTLNVIAALAAMLSGKRPVACASARFSALLTNAATKYDLRVEIQKQVIVDEFLSVDGIQKLNRGEKGIGEIHTEELNKSLRFQNPESQLALVSRRDLIQHGFLEPLHEWASGLRFFKFGTPLGRENMAIFVKDGPKFDPADTDQVIPAFREGKKIAGDAFVKSVIADMAKVGYDLEDVAIHTFPDLPLNISNLPGEPQCLFVKEKALNANTEQVHMSQGMFRALSVIVQINFGIVSSAPSCILIDDIGEGLDFERSCSLISLLMEKALSSKVQLIMSTNDRFVMNKVPLEYWAIIHRDGHKCRLLNYSNSKEQFDDFKFTGLNNFDFFATNFLETKIVSAPIEDPSK